LSSTDVPEKYFPSKILQKNLELCCHYLDKAIPQKKIKKIDLQLALDSKYGLILKSRLPTKAPK
jgi:hypothetical protein